MSQVKILFFAADPLSAPPSGRVPRLLLDEDVRQIREKVRAAKHRYALEFDWRLAARTDDLLQALNETRPQVVHFSGHGGNEGLVLVGADGRGARYVDAAALAELFQVFRGDIRAVVLNACFSLPQAEAIAEAVGCAIGTSGKISDQAAITFGASFYRAIAFGESVQAAYDQARLALKLEHFEDRECPQLVVRPGVDPARLVLVPPDGTDERKRGLGRVGTAIAGLALAGAAVAASVMLSDWINRSGGAEPADSGRAAASTSTSDTSTAPDSSSAPDSTPATAPAAVNPRTARRQDDGGGRRVVPTEPAAASEQRVETLQGSVDPSTVRKLPGPRDTFSVPDGRPRDRTIAPALPSAVPDPR